MLSRHHLWAIFCAVFGSSWAAAQMPHTAAVTPNDRIFFDRIIRSVEPDGVGKPHRLPQYCAAFRRDMINDPRLFAFEAVARAGAQDEIVLEGFVEFRETHEALLKFLHCLGFEELDDRLQLLPDPLLGSERFALVTKSHALCFARPFGEREVVTECLLGDPIYLLREAASEMLLCHSAEGYLGYLEAAALRRVNAEEFARYQGGGQVFLRRDHKLDEGLTLPVGARLRLHSRSADQLVVELPTGATAAIPPGCGDVKGGSRAGERIERIVENALTLNGTPYLWGGKSSAGVDCSGLMQVAFAAEGLHLPRDSNQQVYLGRLTATRWHRAGMRRGDTLYFLGSRGKIRHTAIYLGNSQFLHAEIPRVRIASFDAQDDNYDARRAASFAFAKRLLD